MFLDYLKNNVFMVMEFKKFYDNTEVLCLNKK